MKNRLKKVLCGMLTATMILSLIACGKKTDDPNSPGGAMDQAAINDAAKQNVFHEEEFKDVMGDNTSMLAANVIGDKIIMITQSWKYDEETEMGSNSYEVMKCGLDGKNNEKTDLKMPDLEEGANNGWFYTMIVNEKSGIYGIQNQYSENYTEDGEYSYEENYNLYHWDLNGEFLWYKNLKKDLNSDMQYIWVRNLTVDNEGNSILLLGGDDSYLIIYDKDGNIKKSSRSTNSPFENTMYSFADESGKIVIVSADYDGNKESFHSSLYDPATDSESDKKEIDLNLYNYNIVGNKGNKLILTNNVGIYTYTIGDTAIKPYMNFINSDINTDYLSLVFLIDDQHFIASYQDNVNWEQKFSYFTYVDPKDIPDKKTLVLACMYFYGTLKEKVVDFNKNNSEYRITVKNYSDYNTASDYMGGYTKLNNDMVSGYIPDIIAIDSSVPIENYVNKGILADIGEMLQNDPELGKLEYLQNVFDAYSINGKLYQTVPSFSVRTMIAKKSVVGSLNKWSMADAMNTVKKLDPDATIFGTMVRESFLSNLMDFCGKDFVDMNTGKCAFNTQEFIEMLEYAKTLPKEFTEDYWDDYDYTFYQTQYRQNKTLLCELYMSSIADAKWTLKGQFGEPVSFIGFPSGDGNGAIIQGNDNMYAISAKSANKEGAWKFVRQFMTEEYQTSDQNYNFPVLKSAFVERAKTATERPHWTDENGNTEYWDDYWYVNDEQILLEPFTQAEVDEMCNYIYNIRKTGYYNQQILDIIKEEAEAFFTNQKSAKDVANIIQSRVQIMVNESR